jgi:hypothetical protein
MDGSTDPETLLGSLADVKTQHLRAVGLHREIEQATGFSLPIDPLSPAEPGFDEMVEFSVIDDVGGPESELAVEPLVSLQEKVCHAQWLP